MISEKRNEHAIQEILHDIQNHDLLKAQLVLQEIESYPHQTQKRLLYEISWTEDSFSLPLLVFLRQEHGELLKVHPGLSDILLFIAKQNIPLILSRIQPIEECLPTYARLSGELKISAATEPLIRVLNKVAAPRVLEPIIEALGRIGNTQAAKPLSEFLFLKDSSLAIQAVFALARICSDQSIAYVTNAIGRDQDIDLAIISACTELDPEKRVNILTLALHRAHPLARDRAEAALEDMGSVALSAMHHSLGHVPIEAQLRILNVLGRLQDRRSLIPLRKLLHSHPEEEIRIAAYQVLDKMALPQDSYILVRGLYDSSEKVRLSAAHAVDRNAGPNMLSGIKNLLQDEDAQNQHILQALLRAKALNVLSYLWTIKTFRQKILLAADSCSDQSVHELVQSLSSKTM